MDADRSDDRCGTPEKATATMRTPEKAVLGGRMKHDRGSSSDELEVRTAKKEKRDRQRRQREWAEERVSKYQRPGRESSANRRERRAEQYGQDEPPVRVTTRVCEKTGCKLRRTVSADYARQVVVLQQRIDAMEEVALRMDQAEREVERLDKVGCEARRAADEDQTQIRKLEACVVELEGQLEKMESQLRQAGAEMKKQELLQRVRSKRMDTDDEEDEAELSVAEQIARVVDRAELDCAGEKGEEWSIGYDFLSRVQAVLDMGGWTERQWDWTEARMEAGAGSVQLHCAHSE
jgi:hypothetical protein